MPCFCAWFCVLGQNPLLALLNSDPSDLSVSLICCSREKLWICMEYCGGGSLQDIYHGELLLLLSGSHEHTETRETAENLPVYYDVLARCQLSFCIDVCVAVTGPLSEAQIAYVSRETLQVSCF